MSRAAIACTRWTSAGSRSSAPLRRASSRTCAYACAAPLLMSSSLTSADIVCLRSTPTEPDSVVCTLAQPMATTNVESAAIRCQEETAAEGNFCRTLEPPDRQHQQQDDDHDA